MTDDTPATAPDTAWWIYRGLTEDALAAGAPAPDAAVRRALDPAQAPPWRRFGTVRGPAEHPDRRQDDRGANFIVDDDVKSHINAALLLRRPLLVTGLPGTGKTSLAYAVARELGLGPVLRWSITSRTELRDGLYSYDALARLQDTQRLFGTHGAAAGRDRRHRAPPWARGRRGRAPSIQDYLKLGPLGSAFAGFPPDDRRADLPRVLLIDEIDKSDIDLPNDLLHIFEDGAFEIEELKRDGAPSHRIATADPLPAPPADRDPDPGAAPGPGRLCVSVEHGRVQCRAFPFVVMTSNSEREFPAPFKRRCIQLTMQRPSRKRLAEIVERKLRHLDPPAYQQDQRTIDAIIDAFEETGRERDLAVDQLLQVVYLRMKQVDPFEGEPPPPARRTADLEDLPAERRKLIDALWKSLREGPG